jgi:hypothetical protein
MPDLMERLTAADPLPHAERLSPEEQREADVLLTRLLDTPVSEEPVRGARVGVRCAGRSRPPAPP